VFLLNVRGDEVKSYARVHSKIRAIDCAKLGEGLESVTSNSYVIIEDIISLSDREEEALRRLINYRAHHDKLRIICVSHMLYKTSLLTLVPLFNYLIFTLTNSSRGLLRAAAVHGFNLEPERHAKWLRLFSERFKQQEASDSQSGQGSAARSFIFISCVGVELYLCENAASLQPKLLDNGNESVDDGGGQTDEKRPMPRAKSLSGASVGSRDDIDARFAECFSNHEEKTLASALFSIVGPALKKEAGFRRTDLSLAFSQSRKPGVLRRVSVVDYVASLLQSQPVSRPSVDLLVVHRFLSERCKIPKLFVKNWHFYDAASDLTSDELEEDDDDDDDNDAKKSQAEKNAF